MAAVATVIIGTMYVCVVVGFNLVEKNRLVGQIDSRLQERLIQVIGQPANAGSIGDYDNNHDVDDSPVFLWRVTHSGRAMALTTGGPALPRSSWSPSKQPVETQLGAQSFRLQARQVDGRWFVAAQSLANADRVRSDLLSLELIAGPILLLAVFFGTLLIGVKAATPVEQARQRQLEFTADASHELRTPLSVIEAEVSLSLKRKRSSEEYKDTLTRISLESLRLRRIVEDLLWLSRFDSEPPPPSGEPVDVTAVAVACADRFAAVAERGEITLLVRDESGLTPWINAPPEWIDRLVAVLVDNACRYAGSKGTVLLVVHVAGNRVCLRVEDTGPGIPLEDRAKLFDRFHRATEIGSGTGLGLAIGDSVVRATGGGWRVGQSELGGACMEVCWRRTPGAKPPELPEQAFESSEPANAPHSTVAT